MTRSSADGLVSAASAGRAALGDVLGAVGQLDRSLDEIASGLAGLASGIDPIRKAALQARLAALEVSIEGRRRNCADGDFIVLAESVRDLAARIEGAAEAASRHLSGLDRLVAEIRRNLGDESGQERTLGSALSRLAECLQQAGHAADRSGRTDAAA